MSILEEEDTVLNAVRHWRDDCTMNVINRYGNVTNLVVFEAQHYVCCMRNLYLSPKIEEERRKGTYFRIMLQKAFLVPEK